MVETVIVARVFGAPLLRVDGTVVLAPGVLPEPFTGAVTVAGTFTDRGTPVGEAGGDAIGDLTGVAARLEATSARQRRVTRRPS